MKKSLLLVIGIIIFLGFTLSGSYNRLISSSQLVDNKWAQVETQYQRRFDLIPSLVKSAEAVMKQERQVFADIAEARTRYSGAQTVEEKSTAATQVESSLSRLLVIMENYPELKSDQTVNRLMDELAGTENRISVERGRFNDQVTSYNLLVKRFPGNLIAKLFGFSPRSLFESVDSASTPPTVEFDME